MMSDHERRAKRIAYGRKWRAANPEKQKSAEEKYRAANKEKVKAGIAKWHVANKEKEKARLAKWSSEHRQARCVNEHNRRARKAIGGALSRDITEMLMALQRGKCACCRVELSVTGHHLDHIVPLALSGQNTDDNVQLLCPTCNLRKGAKDPIIFMQQQGFLL